MEVKYICPKCGSQLKEWEEFVFEKQYLINSKTGLKNKRLFKTDESYTGLGGLCCSKCDFVYSGYNCEDNEGNNHKYLDELFEILNDNNKIVILKGVSYGNIIRGYKRY